jgi:glutathione peroxidase-family protein
VRRFSGRKTGRSAISTRVACDQARTPQEREIVEYPGHSGQDLADEPTTLGALGGKALLVVNVASKCGLTPQYSGLERLQERYADKGFSVVGFPCNQFADQEPGTAEEIQAFCLTTYGVSFPLFEKVEVNAGTHSTRNSPGRRTPTRHR